jgi:peroxiredoxin Q/BCP
VSFDPPEANKRFAEKFKFPFPLLCDTKREIGLAYGAADSPTAEYAKRIAYVIDEEGKIAQAHPKVDPASYPHTQLETI